MASLTGGLCIFPLNSGARWRQRVCLLPALLFQAALLEEYTFPSWKVYCIRLNMPLDSFLIWKLSKSYHGLDAFYPSACLVLP